MSTTLKQERKREKEGGRERERERERKERQTDRWTKTERDRQAEKERELDKLCVSERERKERQTDRWTKTERQTGRQRKKESWTNFVCQRVRERVREGVREVWTSLFVGMRRNKVKLNPSDISSLNGLRSLQVQWVFVEMNGGGSTCVTSIGHQPLVNWARSLLVKAFLIPNYRAQSSPS